MKIENKECLKYFILFFSIVSLLSSCNSRVDLKPIQVTSELVFVTGKVLNPNPENKTVTIYVMDILSGDQITNVSLIDSGGDFQIKLNQYYSQDVLLRYGDNSFPIIVHPKDSIHIVFDAEKISNKDELARTIQFSGDANEINTKLIAFHSKSSEIFIPWEKYCQYEKDYSSIEFTTILDSLKSVKETLMNNLISKQSISEELKTWMKYDIEMDYNNRLALFPFDKARFNDLNYDTIVPLAFYDFMNISFPEEALSNSNSTSFISRYIYGRLKSLKFKTANKYYVEGVIGFFAQLKTGVYFGSPIKEELEIITSSTDEILLKEILIARCLNGCIQRGEVAEFEKHLSLFDKTVKAPFLRETIINKYLERKQHLENPTQEENTLLKLAKDTPANELIDTIFKEHKGKIIYLDIWATWCSPCRKEMPFSKELKHELNNDSIAFVYLCVDSKEDIWKAMISEIGIEGSHYLATAEQSRFLYKLFEMNGVPQYVLVDKKGNIIEKGIQLRPSESLVRTKILNLLKE